jgi:hypothetical protein
MASDFAVFQMVGAQIKPGGFDLAWLVKVLNFVALLVQKYKCGGRRLV